MVTKSRKIRNEFRFARPLDESEAALLTKTICWRSGSSVIRDESGNAIGCVAHPDDVDTFRRELREHGIRIGTRVSGELVTDEEFEQRMKRIAKRFRVDVGTREGSRKR